jgi:hypothetical protein
MAAKLKSPFSRFIGRRFLVVEWDGTIEIVEAATDRVTVKYVRDGLTQDISPRYFSEGLGAQPLAQA